MTDVLVEEIDHLEDGVGRFRQVRQYERIGIPVLCDSPEKPTLYICADTHLSGFQHQRTDVALRLHLLFKPLMQPHLTPIKDQRLLLTLFTHNLENILRVERKGRFELSSYLFDLCHDSLSFCTTTAAFAG